jgi:hypothetical protein
VKTSWDPDLSRQNATEEMAELISNFCICFHQNDEGNADFAKMIALPTVIFQ